jgi:Flp pilus assembly protein TadD
MLLFIAALLSKTTACTLPATIALLLWWKRPRLTVRDVMPLLPMFVVGIGMGLNTARLERMHVGALGADWDFSTMDRVLIAGRALWFYFAKLLWPATLVFIYPRWSIDDSAMWQYAYPAGALALALTLFLLRNRIGKGPFVAAAFFAGTLFPALGFVNVYPMLFSFVADHFQYLASLGPIALGAALLMTAARKLGQTPGVLCGVAIVAVLGLLTWRQGHMYANRLTLWQTTVDRNPSAWIAQNNLSVELFKLGRYAEALERAQKTLALRPQYSKAYNNVGQALEGLGRISEALVNYNRAIELNPADPEPYLNLGNALYATGDVAGAERNIRAAIDAAPWYSGARHNLAVLQFMRGQMTEAIVSCTEAIRLDAYSADSHMLMGILLAQSGNRDQAVLYLRRALRLNPNLERARAEIQRLGVKP